MDEGAPYTLAPDKKPEDYTEILQLAMAAKQRGDMGSVKKLLQALGIGKPKPAKTLAPEEELFAMDGLPDYDPPEAPEQDLFELEAQFGQSPGPSAGHVAPPPRRPAAAGYAPAVANPAPARFSPTYGPDDDL